MSHIKALAELARILRVLPEVEWGRRRLGPRPLVGRLRARGAGGARRSDAERQRLRRLIRVVDRGFPGGGNCFRRALIEIALDPVSASETLYMALREHGGAGSGHAWLGQVPDTNETYDAVFVA